MKHIVCRLMQEQDMEMVMNWRMQPDITKYMSTDPILSLEEQLQWFNTIQQDCTCYYWIVEVDKVPVGVTNITNIDLINERCCRGTYIAVKEKRSMDLILSLYSTQFDFVFDYLKLNKIEVEILKDNIAVLRLNQLCGFKVEGISEQHIKKNGVFYDVVRMGICRKDWKEKKKDWKYDSVQILLKEGEYKG